MTFTYDPSNPTPTNVELVRKRIGDTNKTVQGGPIFQDEEITVELVANGQQVLAAAQTLARMALAKWSRETDASGAGINIQRSQKFQQMLDVLKSISRELMTTATPDLVGSSISRAEQLSADTDYPNTPFKLGWGKNT